MFWFDLENAPHVWVLKEFISSFKKEGFDTLITARDFSVTVNLCNYLGVNIDYFTKVSNTKSRLKKLSNTINRGVELSKFLKSKNIKPVLSISHGSRSQAFASSLLKIPVISLDDYEYSSKTFNYFVNYILSPFPIPKDEWGIFKSKVIHYPGLKEELYLWNESNYKTNFNDILLKQKINVVFRPEGRFTHYSSQKSLLLQNGILNYFTKQNNIRIILIARDKIQEQEISNFLKNHNCDVIVPQNVLNGPALLNNADIVIGGGGTMTREASVLGTPSYTFFGGKLGNVDKYLIEKNKLVFINSIDDIKKIRFIKKKLNDTKVNKDAFNFVYKFILEQYLKNT